MKSSWINKEVVTPYGNGRVLSANQKGGECVLTVTLFLCRSRIEVLANEVEVVQC